MVQDILNDLDGDEVNSINDTVDSQKIAQIIKTTYYNIISGIDYPHLFELFTMTGLGNVNKPNYLQIPESIEVVKWLKYNIRSSTDTKDKYTEIKYISPEEFITLVDARDSSLSTIQVVQDYSGVTMNIYKDRQPTYYTSFDDDYIILDSFDNSVDTTVQSSKTKSFGKRKTTFTIDDDFIPDLHTQMFSYLLSEAKSMAFSVEKQALNPKVEQISRVQRHRMSQDGWKLKRGISYPNYGRK